PRRRGPDRNGLFLARRWPGAVQRHFLPGLPGGAGGCAGGGHRLCPGQPGHRPALRRDRPTDQVLLNTEGRSPAMATYQERTTTSPATPGTVGQSGPPAGVHQPDLAAVTRSRTWGQMIWSRLRRDRFALAGAALVLFTIFLAVAAPVISPHDPLAQDSSIRLSPIGTPGHLLGTDGNGRDILSRLIYGSQTALLVASVPVVVAGVLGMGIGLASGYFGGLTDTILMRLSDILFAFPAILLAIAIVAALGPTLVNAMLALAIVLIPAFARLVRASVLSIRERE